MQIQINPGQYIEDPEGLVPRICGVAESELSRYSDHITRVEIHLSAMIGHTGSQKDNRCMMEARLDDRRPVAVTYHAATLDQAVNGAAGKLSRLIESVLGRRHYRLRHRTDPPPAGSTLTEQP